MSGPARTSVQDQLMRMAMVIITVSIVLSCAGSLYLTLKSDRESLDSNLLNSAYILAETPLVRNALTGQAPQEELAAFLERATDVPTIDLILVADTENKLYYATQPELVGTVYAGQAQMRALEGASPYTSDETGPLGSDHSAYAPVWGTDGTPAGYVVVGVYTRSMAQAVASTVLRFLAIGLLTAAVGALLAMRLSRRIKDTLLGYEPAAFARRFLQREDILEALEEGVLAVDKSAGIIFLNDAAAQMLSLDRQSVLGRPLREVYSCPTMERVLRTGQAEYNVPLTPSQEIRVLSDWLPLSEGGAPAGAVGIFRNRTEVTRLTNDLTGVHHLVEAMRAYTHEFTNKLHVILGLLELGQPERAQQYILDTSHTHQEAVGRIVRQIQEPSVAALLVGKTSRASELGIRLILDRESSLQAVSPWLSPSACVTIMGNLIENAIEGLNQSHREPREVYVSIRETRESLLLCVEDTGPGIPDSIREHLFDRNVSSKGPGRGTGLALVREVADAYRGSIRVESAPDVGTSFFVTFRRENRLGEDLDCTES